MKILKLLLPMIAAAITTKAQTAKEMESRETAQTEDSVIAHTPANPFSISGYAEIYYCYDFNQPSNNMRPGFVYSHNRHNEFTANLAFLKGNYNSDRVRGNLAIMMGTYANANLAAEPGVLKNIFEANIGVKLSKKADLWIDAGIMPSHIGFESAISKDCWTLTRSMVADNSPYYESGAKLSYTTKNEKLYLAALLLNGWQRIQRVDGNSTIGVGTQITYKPSGKITLNYSTFFGNDKPDSLHQTRMYHNVYGVFQFTEKLGLAFGFDYGMEQKAKGSTTWNTWYTPTAIVRYQPSSKTAIAARVEYYADEQGVIIASGTPNGFKTWGYSGNFDLSIWNNVLWRIEGKLLQSEDAVFTDAGKKPSTTNFVATTSLAISF